MQRSRSWRIMSSAMVAVITLSACGSDSGAEDVDTDQPSESPEAENDDGAADSTSSDEPVGAVEAARSGLSNPVGLALDGGGELVAGIECGLDGAHLLIVGVNGLTPGDQHDAEIEPNRGQSRFFVQENGDGYSGYQSRFEDASYTLTWPNIDSGVSVTVDGCPG